MGEIDTKPIESVQTALTFLGQKGAPRKSNSSSEEMEGEKDIEILLRDLANCNVQPDAKDSAYLQLQFKLQNYRKTSEQLSTALKNSEFNKAAYAEALRQARLRIAELETESETQKIKDQLSRVESELKATQAELLRVETELAAAREEKVKALKQAEMMETAVTVEKERAEDLVKHVNDLNESIIKLQLAVARAEKEKASTDLIGKGGENSDQELYIGALETERNHLRLQLLNASDEVNRLNCEVEMLTDKLEKAKTEMIQVKKYEKADPFQAKDTNKSTAPDKNHELESLENERTAMMAKIAELRTRAEQALSRAEAAEKAKMELEEQLKRWQEQKQRRKAALAALREESSLGQRGPDVYGGHLKKHEPLGKVLNIRF